MDRIQMILASADKYYIELFMRYVETSEYAHKVTVKSFSQPDTLRHYIQLQPYFDLLAAETPFLDSVSNGHHSGNVIVELVENDLERPNGKWTAVKKYQPLNVLLSSLLSAYVAERGQALSFAKMQGKARVVAFYSAVGGIGKTTVALNAAKQLGLRGERVFYLNLETLNSSGIFFGATPTSGQSNKFAQFLYYMKAGHAAAKSGAEQNRAGEQPPETALTPLKYKSHDPATKADYFEPIDHADEMMQMTKADTLTLLDLMADCGGYDVILVDLESSLHERNVTALSRSDSIIWLTQDDVSSIHKTDIWLRQMKNANREEYAAMLRKTRFVVNRYMGKMTNRPAGSDMQIYGYLPYVPSWKQVNRTELLLLSPVFQTEVLKLCMGGMGAGSGTGGGARRDIAT
ncbi:AAA family ATPase [Paenibacillus sp. MSJ-34]|uniref:AAA family ATPase n=1 Tax=Paenibacillus sp. MSJ-34 TaxID=2841529 RepID=UPI001C0FBB61|nr:AAA family ATPase [Paenibacillus sp. MSJ-34]MBU5440720.1 AAA family ATPase [Paenibacillus sp. MSJ-34]